MLKGKWCSSGWCLKQIVQVTRVMLWKGLWGLHWQELVRHQTWTCCLHGQLLCHNSPNTENEAAKRSHAPGKSWAKHLCPVVFAPTSLMVWPHADGNAAVQAADVNSSSGVLLDTAWARYSHSHCRQVCPCRHKSKTWKWRNSKTPSEQTVRNKLMIWCIQITSKSCSQLLVKLLHLADDFHLSMVERMPFLHLEGLGSTSTSAQAVGFAKTGDLSFLPNGQSWQLLLQTSQLLIWKNTPNISRKTVWPRIFDDMSQLQIMIFLFDVDLVPKPAISIKMPSYLNSLGFMPPPRENLPLHLFQGCSGSFQSWWNLQNKKTKHFSLVNLISLVNQSQLSFSSAYSTWCFFIFNTCWSHTGQHPQVFLRTWGSKINNDTTGFTSCDNATSKGTVCSRSAATWWGRKGGGKNQEPHDPQGKMPQKVENQGVNVQL